MLPTNPDNAMAFFALLSLFFGWLFGGVTLPIVPLPASDENVKQTLQVIWGRNEKDPATHPAPPPSPTLP